MIFIICISILKHVSEEVLFFLVLEVLIGGPCIKNIGERSIAKKYCPVSLLSVVSKVFEKLVNNRIVDHLKNCGLFSDFQYGFRSSWSTAGLLTVIFDRIARAFNRFGATQAVALDISKAFDRVWHAGLLPKHKSYGISGQLYCLISSFLRNRLRWVILYGRSSQEYPVNAGVPQAPFLVLHFSCYTLMTFLMTLSVILLSMLMTLLSNLSVIKHLSYGKNKNWLLNLNLTYIVDWDRKGVVDFNAGKTCFFFDRSSKTGSVHVKMDGSFLQEKIIF